MKAWKLAAVCGVVFGAAGAANAQVPVPNPFDLTYRVGFFLPTSESGRDIGKNWFAAGVDWPLMGVGVPTTDLNASGFISLDYYEKEGNRALPVMINYRASYSQFSYISGVGISFNRLDGDEKATITYQLGIGFNISGGGLPISLEARWWQQADSELSGIGVYLGLKF
jgi:hypothetical protein